MATNKRDMRPAFVGAAINKLLSRLGAKASDAELAARWTDIMGDGTEMMKMSRGIKGRTIYVRAKNPAERLAVSYQSADMIKKINDYFGYDAVEKVVVR